MRRLIAAGTLLALTACSSEVGPEPAPEEPSDPVEAARAFVEDARIRRAALETSAAVADAPYNQLRLDHYSLAGAGIDDPLADWDLNPVVVRDAVRRLRVPLVDGDPTPEPFEAGPIVAPWSHDDLDAWVAAGRRAFELCPIQIDARFGRLRRGAEVARSFGLHVTDEGEVRGAVELKARDGRWLVALTCAACHSSTAADGRQVPGLPNPDLRIGELLGTSDWHPGTIDVTPDEQWNPVRPADLRAVALQARLHHAGNLANGRIARMIRIETLIESHFAYEARPDRRVVAAMALYLESLAGELPAPDWSAAGAAEFTSECGACHGGDAMAGPPVLVDVVGTDPAATVGSTRGTGAYRAPSLRGVAERRGLLHDGSAADLEAVLRLESSEHVGHEFGTGLPLATRRAIAGFLGAIP